MYVFVVLTAQLSEHTILTEVRAVFAHMPQAQRFAQYLRKLDGVPVVRVIKHQVIEHWTEPVSLPVGGGVERGVQAYSIPAAPDGVPDHA